jgi:hypothetical protein
MTRHFILPSQFSASRLVHTPCGCGRRGSVAIRRRYPAIACRVCRRPAQISECLCVLRQHINRGGNGTLSQVMVDGVPPGSRRSLRHRKFHRYTGRRGRLRLALLFMHYCTRSLVTKAAQSTSPVAILILAPASTRAGTVRGHRLAPAVSTPTRPRPSHRGGLTTQPDRN